MRRQLFETPDKQLQSPMEARGDDTCRQTGARRTLQFLHRASQLVGGMDDPPAMATEKMTDVGENKRSIDAIEERAPISLRVPGFSC
jgi:hypothetical protein